MKNQKAIELEAIIMAYDRERDLVYRDMPGSGATLVTMRTILVKELLKEKHSIKSFKKRIAV